MTKGASFEDNMKELADIVKQLENKDNTLDDSLYYFEKGVTLTKKCQTILDRAEQKVNVLLDDGNGGKKEEPFTAEEE